MPRRKQSLFDEVVEIAAMLPWWAGVLLAAISYVALHGYAGTPVTSPSGGKAVLDAVAPHMLRGVAKVGQYFPPCIFLLGAGLSAYKRHKRITLHDQVAARSNRQSIESLSWQEFEHLVGAKSYNDTNVSGVGGGCGLPYQFHDPHG